jgi:HEAT repeat protein
MLDLEDQAEIHRMALSEDVNERIEAVLMFFHNFDHLIDKEQGWKDLHRLTQDKVSLVRRGVASVFYSSFYQFPNKEHAWEDLLQLIQDEKNFVRYSAALALGSALPHVPNKEQAWEIFHNLTKDGKIDVRKNVARSFGSAFPYAPNEENAWEDLHRLTQDDEWDVRKGAASALGSAFPHIIKKELAWLDLSRLTKDVDSDVRQLAYHSMGKVYIYRATEVKNEEKFKEELEKAIECFEKSLEQKGQTIEKSKIFFNPAEFCLPFYRSYYAIIFKPHEAEKQVQNSLSEAKKAIAGSERKEKLLKLVRNLSNLLKKAQKLHDFNDFKSYFKIYRRQCERATDLLDSMDESAPQATKLIRKGLPIIDERIKGILAEIEEKTKNLCKESHKTPFEKIGRSAYEQIKGLGKLDNEVRAEIKLYRLKNILQSMCIILPDESKEIICDQLDTMQDQKLNEIVGTVMNALIAIQPQIINLKEKLTEKDKQIEFLRDSLITRLDNINYGVFHLKLNSGDTKLILLQIQNELKKLTTIEKDVKKIGISMTEMGQILDKNHQRLIQDIAYLCDEIETSILPKLPKTDETQRILEKLQDLKQSRGEKWLSRAADLTSLIGFMLQLLK